MVLKSPGDRLHFLRKEEGLTLKELGEHLGGISPAAVSYKINGSSPITIDDAEKLYDVFNVRQAWLLTGDGAIYEVEGAAREPKVRYARNGSLFDEQAVTARFVKALDYVMESEKVKSYRELGELWDINETMLNDMRHGRKQVSRETIKAVLRVSGISANYLYGGIGPMMVTEVAGADTGKMDRLLLLLEQQSKKLEEQGAALAHIQTQLKRA